MSIETFDVVILGGGNAGIGVTGPVRRAGMSIAMIESHDLGGTCPNRGCTPKKVLVAAGHALHEIERAAIHHISVGKPKLDWSALIDREKDLIKDIPANLARSMARRDVEVIKDHATFAGPNAICVGDRRLEAKHIVIATGSMPRRLPIPGAEHRVREGFNRAGAGQAAEAERVMNGAGRDANVDTLDLAAGRVEHGNGRVAVDCHLRSTSNPAVYVCGDALPISPQLSPIATYEGDIVGRNIVAGPKYSPDYASKIGRAHV